MEKGFRDRFYRPWPKVTIVNLMNLKQQVDESVADFLEWFKKLISRCNVQSLESKYANITMGNMHPQQKRKAYCLGMFRLNMASH